MNKKPAFQFMKRAILWSLAILVLAVVASLVWATTKITVSLLAGAVISIVSFTILVLVLTNSIAGGSKAVFVAILGMIKMCIIGFVLWWLLTHGFVEPLSFMAGFSTMVIALIIEGARVSS